MWRLRGSISEFSLGKRTRNKVFTEVVPVTPENRPTLDISQNAASLLVSVMKERSPCQSAAVAPSNNSSQRSRFTSDLHSLVPTSVSILHRRKYHTSMMMTCFLVLAFLGNHAANVTVSRADLKADDTFLQDLVNPNMVPDGSDNLLTGRKCPQSAT